MSRRVGIRTIASIFLRVIKKWKGAELTEVYDAQTQDVPLENRRFNAQTLDCPIEMRRFQTQSQDCPIETKRFNASVMVS